jgi:hypothetical protein
LIICLAFIFQKKNNAPPSVNGAIFKISFGLAPYWQLIKSKEIMEILQTKIEERKRK